MNFQKYIKQWLGIEEILDYLKTDAEAETEMAKNLKEQESQLREALGGLQAGLNVIKQKNEELGEKLRQLNENTDIDLGEEITMVQEMNAALNALPTTETGGTSTAPSTASAEQDVAEAVEAGTGGSPVLEPEPASVETGGATEEGESANVEGTPTAEETAAVEAGAQSELGGEENGDSEAPAEDPNADAGEFDTSVDSKK